MKTGFIKKAPALIGAMAALMLFGPSRADAALIVLAPSISGVVGSSGSFDIVLENTGGEGVSIGSFSVGISTSNAGITFTDATTATSSATYLFSTDSLFGPDIAISTGTSLSASDASIAGDLVPAGGTVGLAHILYTIAGNAVPGPFAITIGPTPAVTSLADARGTNIPIDTLTNGSLNVTSTPEPAGLGLLGGLALAAAFVIKKKYALQ